MALHDPSQGVHRELLPHVHLLSTYRFPTLQNLHHNKVAEWLLSAPKIVRDTSPFYWSYLDRPTDGTILLTWQPLEALSTTFATDGYVWPPMETAFQLEVDGGFVLEMYQHKSGYGPGEPYAIHGRRRYRLLPSKYSNPALPNPDPALWITHYFQADPTDRVPSNLIPAGDPRTQMLMQTRLYLQTQGQIVQKEFMLHDRTNWPQIPFPRTQGRQQPYSMGAARTPQSMAYPSHQLGAGNLAPPAKRARTQANANQGPAAIGALPPVDTQDDEEDTSRGDLFDHMTPREVSMSRYKQNHEWMEEILSSPYSVGQILPVDLGLGLRGELGKLTDGIFEAPNGVDNTPTEYSGRLDPVKADEFRNRAADYIAETNAEMERMKVRHAKRMAKFKRNVLINEAEQQLRTAVQDPTDVGPEYWRLEGRTDENDDMDDRKQVAKIQLKVDEIVAQVEASLGRHAVAVQELKRIQDGGLEESQPVPSPPHMSREPSRTASQQSGVLIGDVDLDMGDSAAGLLDQFHTGFSSTSTPGNSFPTPQAHLQVHSSTGTPGRQPSPQPSIHNEEQKEPEVAQLDPVKEDVEMSDATKEGQVTSDWVVVPEGGVSPPSIDSALPQKSPREITATTTVPVAEASAIEPAPTTPETPDQPADLDIGGITDNFTTDADADVNDFGSLEDLDTAGEALAGYGASEISEHGGDLGGDLDIGMDMGLDDSAFGDAFHGVEPRDGDAEGEGI